MNLLKKYLNKIGVKDYSELTEEEKATYRIWEESLNGRKLTDEDVAAFLDTELEVTLAKLINSRLSDREDLFLKVKIDFIRKVKVFLQTPEMEKKMLEVNINNQLK